MKKIKKHKSPDRIRDPKRIEKKHLSDRKKKLHLGDSNPPKYRHQYLNEEE